MVENIWLDDERDPALWGARGYRWFKTGEALVAWLEENGMDNVGVLDLDHDLGSGRMTGYDVMCWVEQRVADGAKPPEYINIHTANPSGREQMRRARFAIYQIAQEHGHAV